ncbi:MAG: phospho-N-acetylmuramoyl-pentapeptide-transferase [Chloroflexota bacterium]
MDGNSIAIAISGLSFLMTVIWGDPLIRLFLKWRIGKIIRMDGPETHMLKMGTPTMGGFMIILPVTLLTILLNAVSLLGYDILGSSIALPLLTMWGFTILGAIDDWEGIRGSRRGLGMRARTKLILQVIMAAGIAIALQYVLKVPQLYWPTAEGVINIGSLYIPIAIIIIVGMANAVNFTDGLDGLAGLIAATAFSAYGLVALVQGQVFLARFCFSLVGALFGFLWFNVHPAKLIMGDAGAQPLGATLAVVALMTGHWLLLPLFAIIPISELLSVIIQVAYFKITKGKRFFKMAPLHHHFELSGWSETQVVQRFWLVSLLFTLLGFAFIFVE